MRCGSSAQWQGSKSAVHVRPWKAGHNIRGFRAFRVAHSVAILLHLGAGTGGLHTCAALAGLNFDASVSPDTASLNKLRSEL